MIVLFLEEKLLAETVFFIITSCTRLLNQFHQLWTQLEVVSLLIKSPRLDCGADRSCRLPSVCSVVSVDPVGLAAATSGYWVSADNQAWSRTTVRFPSF